MPCNICCTERNFILLTLAGVACCAGACSVYDFGMQGFAANTLMLFKALPILEANGTVFLDNSKLQYRCNNGTGGGWHDFFERNGVNPWTEETKERHGNNCRWWAMKDVQQIMAQFELTTPELHAEAAPKVCRAFEACGVQQSHDRTTQFKRMPATSHSRFRSSGGCFHGCRRMLMTRFRF